MSIDKENIEICNKAICACFLKRKKISQKENVSSLVKQTKTKQNIINNAGGGGGAKIKQQRI